MNKSGWLIFIGIITLFFLYLIRGILAPFVLAAIFAYIFNPVVNLISKKTGLPRLLAIISIYVVILGAISYVSVWLGGQLLAEAKELAKTEDLAKLAETTIKKLPTVEIAGRPVGFQAVLSEIITALGEAAQRLEKSFLPIFTGVAAVLAKFLIFIVASFYFLKDGERWVGFLKQKISRKDFVLLLDKLNSVLGGYLQGQVLMVIIMSTATWIALTILGVRFALILGIITGFLELIPLIGPWSAGGLAALTAFLTKGNHFGLDPTGLVVVVAVIYFGLRMLEDYFVIPQLLGRLTRLHPLAVLFAVLAGGSLAGPVGFILGVPVAASLRVLLEYRWGSKG
jgi:predicted PurR-regulated permease PerM